MGKTTPTTVSSSARKQKQPHKKQKTAREPVKAVAIPTTAEEEDDDLNEQDLEDIFSTEDSKGGNNDQADEEVDGEDQGENEEGEGEGEQVKKFPGVPEGMQGGLAIYQINEDEDDDSTALELQALLASKGPIKMPDEINDVGLMQRLDDIKLGNGKIEVPWVETLDITGLQPTVIENINDDLKRELAFYNQALTAAKYARQKLDELKYPHRRPEDYFAEMIKSDSHMSKIRMHMLKQKQEIEEAEARRKNREMKKYGKQVQREKQEERQKKKKADLEAIKKWRKDREQGRGDETFPLDKKPQGQNKGGAKKPGQPVNKKREYKNSKFGFGGKKKGSKENTKESFYGLDRQKNQKGGGIKKGGNRPGKRTRAKGRR